MANKASSLDRPYPPISTQSDNLAAMNFQPALEIYDWLHETVLNEHSALYNPDHEHLIEHDGVCFLWAEEGFVKQGRRVLGQAEIPAFRVSGWQKLRQEAQMIGWFGFIPSALITLDANYCSQCSDEDFCALVEHELYHLAQRVGASGPCFDSMGRASLTIRGHDVEEFFGVVQRYGATEDVQRIVDLANSGPTISRASVAHACGTCLLKLA